jgi:hypothetical protein
MASTSFYPGRQLGASRNMLLMVAAATFDREDAQPKGYHGNCCSGGKLSRVVTLCSLEGEYRLFGGKCCLNVQRVEGEQSVVLCSPNRAPVLYSPMVLSYQLPTEVSK